MACSPVIILSLAATPSPINPINTNLSSSSTLQYSTNHPLPPSLPKQHLGMHYAAALLDISLCQNSIHSVFKDVTRFANLVRAKPVLELMRNSFIDAKEKNQSLKELIDNGKFEKHFTALMKMLIVKNKFGLIGDVLEAFWSMYYELCGGNRGRVSISL